MPTREQMLEANDPICDWMVANVAPEQWTRRSYLELNWMGNSPAELDGELEADMPEIFQRW